MGIAQSTDQLQRELERNKDRLLSLREVMDLVPALGEAEVRAALEGLVTGKRVDHPATDLYWCGTMTRLGPVPASVFAVVMKVYEGVGGVGRAGLDAINHMHLSTQMTAREMYAVPFLVDGIRARALRLVDRSDRLARSGLGFFEVTLLETLGESDSWEVGAGPGLTRLTQVVARSGVTLDKEALVRGAADEPESAQELLGELLHIVA